MSFLQKLLQRGRNGADPLRESAAMTTVYLQEQNKRFEAFVREKIAELESVVSGLEARAATVAAPAEARPDVTPAVMEEQTSVLLLTPEETAPAEDELSPEEQTFVSPPAPEIPAVSAEPLPDTAAGYSLLDAQVPTSLLTPNETAPAEDDLPREEQTFVSLPAPEIPAASAEPLPDTAAGYSLLNEQTSTSLLTPEETAPAEDDLPPDESPEEWQRFLGVGPKGEFE